MTIYEYLMAEYNRTAPGAWDEVEDFANWLFWCYEHAPKEYHDLAVIVGIDPTAPI